MERSGPFKRNSELKRTGFKRKKRKFNHAYKPTKAAVTRASVQAKKDFHEAARDQRVCAVCGRADSFDAHHVIEASYLKREGHVVYVKANALRLCDRFAKNNCHGKHTLGGRRVRMKELTDENIEYAFALLGPGKAENYLRRHYRGDDPRLDQLVEDYGEQL